MLRFDQIDELTDRCVQFIEDGLKAADESLQGLVAGSHEGDYLDQLGLLLKMLQQYPPQELVHQITGQRVRVSPWEFALAYLWPDDAELSKHERALAWGVEQAASGNVEVIKLLLDISAARAQEVSGGLLAGR